MIAGLAENVRPLFILIMLAIMFVLGFIRAYQGLAAAGPEGNGAGSHAS